MCVKNTPYLFHEKLPSLSNLVGDLMPFRLIVALVVGLLGRQTVQLVSSTGSYIGLIYFGLFVWFGEKQLYHSLLGFKHFQNLGELW